MSTDEEPSPKRSRFNSYSPASPAPAGASAFAANPHTPPPSVRMSPSWQSQNPLKRPHDQSSSSDASFPTPSSTAGAQQIPGLRGGGGGGSEQQTPTADGEHEGRMDGDGDAEMADVQHGAVRETDVLDAEHRRTDHERYQGDGDNVSEAMSGAKTLYKLSTAPIPRSRPHASDNLIKMYDLQNIQASVARKDPVTGAKINRLRKSYEGKLKLLGLEGRNKAQANQRELEGLAEEGWDAPQPDGRTYFDMHFEGIELGNQAAEASLLASLGAALSFEVGRLPGKDHDEWKSVLGLDDATGAKGAAGASAARPSAAAAAIAKTSPNIMQRNSAPASPANTSHRPDRTNKRRRYDDSSFEGYDNDDGYSTGGDNGRRSGSQKRQKRKDFPSAANSPAFASSSNSGNMVGVRGS